MEEIRTSGDPLDLALAVLRHVRSALLVAVELAVWKKIVRD